MICKKSTTQCLQTNEIVELVLAGLEPVLRGRKNALFIIPDSTRSMPLPLLFPAINQAAKKSKCHIDYLIALGTHPPLSTEEIGQLLGTESFFESRNNQITRVFNHNWKDKKALTCLGTISEQEVSHITDGLLNIEIPVVINKLILAYDQIVICGPIFPHEVAGFSGGEKYLFPGIAGEEIIHITHWLGALSTSMETIGKMKTPVRQVIQRAAEFIETPIANMAFCIKDKEVFGLFIGDLRATWIEAVKLSTMLNIIYVPEKYRSVLSMPANLYDELWTAAKAMYKLEPVVSDGGELIIFAPNINEISVTHGKSIKLVGYHVKDYFIKQWDQYCNYPWAVLAHSTHLKGKGTFENGIELPRIQVKLATGIPEELCHQINLGYIDPETISPKDWENKSDRLLVKNAGEVLYKSR